MTHYEERLEKELNDVEERFDWIANQVQEALQSAVRALVTANGQLAYATVLGDGPINRAVRELDQRCHKFMAVYMPSAGHLRFISSVVRSIVGLERIGDYAVSISRESVQLSKPLDPSVVSEVELLAEKSMLMLKQALTAFTQRNAGAAKATMAMADQVEHAFDKIYASLLTETPDHARLKDLFAIFVVFSLLERVSDHAKNICEDTVFAVTGEVKAKKVYKILFVDENNDCASQMGELIARKNYPNAGQFSSYGRHPAASLDPGMVSLLEQRGMDLYAARPKALEFSPQELAEHHVIVSLQGPVKSYIPEIPFHTAALEWDVGSKPEGLSEDESQARYEEMYRELSVHIRDLMELLRGKEEES